MGVKVLKEREPNYIKKKKKKDKILLLFFFFFDPPGFVLGLKGEA